MKWIGKKIVEYFGIQGMSDEYCFEITDEIALQLLNWATNEELQALLDTAVRFEEYEWAEMIKIKLKNFQDENKQENIGRDQKAQERQ